MKRILECAFIFKKKLFPISHQWFTQTLSLESLNTSATGEQPTKWDNNVAQKSELSVSEMRLFIYFWPPFTFSKEMLLY